MHPLLSKYWLSSTYMFFFIFQNSLIHWFFYLLLCFSITLRFHCHRTDIHIYSLQLRGIVQHSFLLSKLHYRELATKSFWISLKLFFGEFWLKGWNTKKLKIKKLPFRTFGRCRERRLILKNMLPLTESLGSFTVSLVKYVQNRLHYK